MINEWDEIDEWAAQFGRWSDLSRELDLPKNHGADHIPSCYHCFGTGHRILDLINRDLVICRKCGGTGLRRTKPKYLDEEIRDIINKIGIEKVRKLIAEYGKKKPRGKNL